MISLFVIIMYSIVLKLGLTSGFLATENNLLSLGECGNSKGCFRSPYGCETIESCAYIATWVDTGDYVEFELLAKTDGVPSPWLSLGISLDNGMDEAIVVHCIFMEKEGNAIVQLYDDQNHLANGRLSSSSSKGLRVDDNLICKFGVNKGSQHVQSSSTNSDISLDDGVFIVMSSGPSSKSGFKLPHLKPLQTTPQKITINAIQNIGTPITLMATGIDLNPCGKGKGCYRSPQGCKTSSDCDFIVTWTIDSEAVKFDVSVNVQRFSIPWTAIGISYDQKMANTSVMDCIQNQTTDKVVVQSSYNSGYSNAPLTPQDIALYNSSWTGSLVDNILTCSYYRRKIIPDTQPDYQKVFNITDADKVYLFVARGEASNVGVKMVHKDIPKISPQTISFNTYSNIGGQNTSHASGNQSISTTGCGNTKGCIRDPPGCESKKCNYVLTWTETQDFVRFEISSVPDKEIADSPWLAVGFSADQLMPSTPVVDCIYNSSSQTVDVQASYNTDHVNEPLSPNATLPLLMNASIGSYADGELYCSFSYMKSVNENDANYNKTAKITSYHYIFLATGSANGTGYKTKHTNVAVTSKMVDFKEIIDTSVAIETNMYVKAHATIMIICWVFLSTIGMFISRYLRPFWYRITSSEACSWFQVHRAIMVSVVMLTLGAVIIILIGTNWKINWSVCMAHAICGLVTIGLMSCNVILGFLRPKPNAPYRPIFNWAHFLLGQFASKAALVAIVFGADLDNAGLPSYAKFIIIGVFLLRIVTDIILTLFKRWSDTDYIPIPGHVANGGLTNSDVMKHPKGFMPTATVVMVHTIITFGCSAAFIALLFN